MHCHILPGIDDGAKNMEMAMALLRAELGTGVVGVVFTPHFHYERTTLKAFVQRRAAAYRALGQEARRCELPIAGKLGAEVYFTPALPALDLKQLAFAGTKYILIELPTTIEPSGVRETLFGVQQQGYTPILAHVERYPYVEEDPGLLYEWVQAGALAQINAAGYIRGGQTARRMEKLIDWNLIHFISSDCHSPDKRPPNLDAAYDRLPAPIARRFSQNAIAACLGREVDPPDPQKPKSRFGHWV